MIREDILTEVKSIESEIIENRRYLHSHAEVGFELKQTFEFVWKKLSEMGYSPIKCGKCGIIASAGSISDNTILLRADMDALPMTEETDIPFASKNGNMHSCGHDTHTAMLLGAATVIKAHEAELRGTVKFMFQPAEETLEGAADMISDGLLSDDTIKAAFMIHSITGVPIPSGTLIVASDGISSPAADYFKITVKGISCHGSTPQMGIDAINAASHILIALQEISARELGVTERAVITIGKFNGGSAGNIIADTAVMEGTIRAYDEKTRNFIKTRVKEIATITANSFRATAEVCFGTGCPTLINDPELSDFILCRSRELLGHSNAISTSELGNTTSGGSEDFAYVSQQIPSVMLSLAAGEPENGFSHPQHHPKATFDEHVLYVGTAVYAYNAIEWLDKHKS